MYPPQLSGHFNRKYIFDSPTFKFEVGGRVKNKNLIQLWHFSWGDALNFGIGEWLTSGNPRSPATTESNADWALRTSMWLQILERASAQPCCAPSWLSRWCDYGSQQLTSYTACTIKQPTWEEKPLGYKMSRVLPCQVEHNLAYVAFEI